MLPLTLAAALIVPAAVAFSKNRPVGTRGDGILRAPVRALPAPAPKLLSARQNAVDLVHHSNGSRYTIDVDIGTPPQKITLILDTGSSDTWVNPTCETAELEAQLQDCKSFPQFEYNKSSSLNVTQYGETLRYGKGEATVRFVTETLSFGCKLAFELSLRR